MGDDRKYPSGGLNLNAGHFSQLSECALSEAPSRLRRCTVATSANSICRQSRSCASRKSCTNSTFIRACAHLFLSLSQKHGQALNALRSNRNIGCASEWGSTSRGLVDVQTHTGPLGEGSRTSRCSASARCCMSRPICRSCSTGSLRATRTRAASYSWAVRLQFFLCKCRCRSRAHLCGPQLQG